MATTTYQPPRGAEARRGKPYVWASWLPRFLAGSNFCLFALWFKAHFKFPKATDPNFDRAKYVENHTKLVARRITQLQEQGFTIKREEDLKLEGRTATLAGQIDILARRNNLVVISDEKTGAQRPSDFWQVLIYMEAVPRVFEELDGLKIVGEVVYTDQVVPIQPDDLTPERTEAIWGLMRTAGGDEPPPKTPSRAECRFCDVPKTMCPERMDPDASSGVGSSNDF